VVSGGVRERHVAGWTGAEIAYKWDKTRMVSIENWKINVSYVSDHRLPAIICTFENGLRKWMTKLIPVSRQG
jgi:hypothetical protein